MFNAMPVIKILIDEIKNEHNKLFNHCNQKFKLEELLECVMIVFFLIYIIEIKLIKTDVIEKAFIFVYVIITWRI